MLWHELSLRDRKGQLARRPALVPTIRFFGVTDAEFKGVVNRRGRRIGQFD